MKSPATLLCRVLLMLACALVAAVLVCTIIGYGLERVAYRPLRRAPRLAPLITAMGLSIIVQHLVQKVHVKDVDIGEHETIGLTPGR